MTWVWGPGSTDLNVDVVGVVSVAGPEGVKHTSIESESIVAVNLAIVSAIHTYSTVVVLRPVGSYMDCT